jgi:serine/threonine protein kinase
MSTYTSEPGTRLGGRYRLEDRLAAAGGWAAWKAIDEILARAVSVITFAPGFPRLEQVVTAARAASRLTDTRLTQVFDVEDSWEHAYIVLEWPVGETLADLLSGGPMDPVAGARIVAEVAAALAGAHAAGLAHLCLRPESVRWTAGGGVKVTGLGIDAALSGAMADDPELADTRGLGQLLYAALTGLWPDAGDDESDLPAAPSQDGLPRRPRQVRAGVPTFLDDVACRALALPGRDGEPAFSAPSQLASALAAGIPPVQVPPAATVAAGRRDGGSRNSGGRNSGGRNSGGRNTERMSRDGRSGAPTRSIDRPGRQAPDRTGPQWQDSQGRGYQAPRRNHGRNIGRAAVVALVAVVAVVAVSAGALHLLHKSPGSGSPGTGSSSSSGSSPSASASVITPVSASGFDALNPTGDAGNENSNQASNVLTGNAQGWSTQFYDSAELGGLKKGTGFILDLGSSVQLRSVTVQFGTQQGADVELKVGDSEARSPANLDSMATVASATDVSGSHTFTISRQVKGRYLVVWFTKLPPMAKRSGKFMAQIFSVAIRGAS